MTIEMCRVASVLNVYQINLLKFGYVRVESSFGKDLSSRERTGIPKVSSHS